MMDSTFSTHQEHVIALDRIGELVALLANVSNTDVMQIPGDGIGVGSIACIMRGLNYVSSEPHGIGDLARRLGIITNPWTFETHMRQEIKAKDIVLASNLSRYVDVSRIYLYRYIEFDMATRGTSVYMTHTATTEKMPDYLRLLDVMTVDRLDLLPQTERARMSVEYSDGPPPTSEAVRAYHNIQESKMDENAYNITERKMINRPPRRYNTTSREKGYVNYYNRRSHFVPVPGGLFTRCDPFIKAKPYLSPQYNIHTNDIVTFVTDFDPRGIRYAMSGAVYVRVTLLNLLKHRLKWTATFQRSRIKTKMELDDF